MRPLSATVVVVLSVAIAACDRKSDLPSPAEVAKEAPVTNKTSPDLVHQQTSLVAADSTTVQDFEQRVKDYIALRSNVEKDVGTLPDKATPRQIDTHQRELAAAIGKARSQSRQGDIFMPAMQKYIQGVVRRVIDGPEGAQIKASLMDENPMQVKLGVNARYPDTIPMSTMPPDVLAALPPLPEDLEYRFVGNRLILLDVRSHLIVDFVDNTFVL